MWQNKPRKANITLASILGQQQKVYSDNDIIRITSLSLDLTF